MAGHVAPPHLPHDRGLVGLIAGVLLALLGVLLPVGVVAAATVPSAPTGVVGSPRSSAVALTWTAPADTGGATITGYRIRYSTDSGRSWSSTVSSNSRTTAYTVTGLRNGRSYVFQVRAVNRIGNSAWSATSAAVTAGAATPTPTPGISSPRPTTTTSAPAPTLTTATTSSAPAPTGTTTTAPPQPVGQRVAVPSYVYPGSVWTQLEQATPVVGLTIINPSSGPGTSVDQNYVNQVRSSRARGISVLGYVDTTYSIRDLPLVKADIDKHFSWYGVDGIFLDQVTSSCVDPLTNYYTELYRYVHAKGGSVVLNPGTNTGECYTASSDILVTYEDLADRYGSWQPAAWESRYAPSRFWHLVIGADSARMSQAVALSRTRNVGWIFVTDDTLPNPWDTLPAYWTQELSLVGS